jgi:hypothetical protein
MGNKPGGYDLIQDERIEAAYQWDKTGDGVVPRTDRPSVIIPGKAVAPSNPPTDSLKMYVVVTGTTPNKVTKFAHKDSNGEEVVISTKVE